MDNQTQNPEPFRAPEAPGAAPSLAAAETDVRAAAADVEQLVDDWFHLHFHGSVGRIETALYNHIHAAKEELKERLRALR